MVKRQVPPYNCQRPGRSQAEARQKPGRRLVDAFVSAPKRELGMSQEASKNEALFGSAEERGAAALRVLSEVFGYDSFRSDQAAVIETVLSAQDALLLMPTGMGKKPLFPSTREDFCRARSRPHAGNFTAHRTHEGPSRRGPSQRYEGRIQLIRRSRAKSERRDIVA